MSCVLPEPHIWQYFLKRTLCDGWRLHGIKYFSTFLIFLSFQINTYFKMNATCLKCLLFPSISLNACATSFAIPGSQRSLAFHSFPVLCMQQRPSYTNAGSQRPLQEMVVSSKGQACHFKHLWFSYFIHCSDLLLRFTQVHSTGLQTSKATLIHTWLTEWVKTWDSSKLLNLGKEVTRKFFVLLR